MLGNAFAKQKSLTFANTAFAWFSGFGIWWRSLQDQTWATACRIPSFRGLALVWAQLVV